MWQDLLSLDALVNPDAPVFRSRTGKALDRSRVLRIVQEAAKRAGVEGGVSPHWLRHAHATHSLEMWRADSSGAGYLGPRLHCDYQPVSARASEPVERRVHRGAQRSEFRQNGLGCR